MIFSPVKNSPSFSSDNQEPHWGVLVFITITLLALHFLIRKISLEHFLAHDHFDMRASLTQSCDFESPIHSILNRCFVHFSAMLYAVPSIYMLSIITTLILKFFLLYKIFFYLAKNSTDILIVFCSALFALVFLTIGGGGRFLIGGDPIFLHASINYRTWSILFSLLGLLLFTQKRYALATLIFCPATLLHPLNSLNIIGILGFAYLFIEGKHGLKKIPLYVSPIIVIAAYQYISYFGWTINLGGSTQTTSTPINARNWFDYIFSQDPDDLSIWYHLAPSNRGNGFLGIGYAATLLFGVFFASQVEKYNSLKTFLKKPGVALIFASLVYLGICLSIELSRSPIFLLEQLIILQPRRALYFPILFCIYYVSRATMKFVFSSERSTKTLYRSLQLFFGLFFSLIFLSTEQGISVSRYASIGMMLVAISGLFLIERARHVEQTNSFSAHLRRFFVPILIALITLKTIPFISNESLNNLSILFFDSKKRTYTEYITIAGELSGEKKSVNSFFELVSFFRSKTGPALQVMTVGLPGSLQRDLHALTKHGFQANDLFHGARGGAHYSKKSFLQAEKYVSQVTNLSISAFSSLTRDEQFALLTEHGRRQFSKSTMPLLRINRSYADYLIFATPCNFLQKAHLLALRNSNYCVYKNIPME
jgi:hypothetical protein